MTLLAVLLYTSGCVTLSPVTQEDRVVRTIDDGKKRVIFEECMVWYDNLTPTRGIRFPEGTYTLEAEDDEYYYFAAPAQLEYRVFRYGKVVDARKMPGGLYLGKKAFKMVPAGAYLSVDNQNKTFTWKLGSDFLLMEGRKWKKNY